MLKIEDYNQKLAQELLSTFRKFPKIMVNRRKSTVQKRSEIMVLFCIKKSGETEMKVSEISRILQVKAPTVTQLVNELENRGQVERITRSSDRRSVWIKITEEGEKVIEKAEEEIRSTYSGLIDYLGEEESRMLIASLDKVYAFFLKRMDEENLE
ncbi:transcriptional regulator, marr family protein [Bacillus sp. 1NLA3E]|nr:transcriptional regulator, marr family protein [Bacillus sp. 1NLA3E]